VWSLSLRCWARVASIRLWVGVSWLGFTLCLALASCGLRLFFVDFPVKALVLLSCFYRLSVQHDTYVCNFLAFPLDKWPTAVGVCFERHWAAPKFGGISCSGILKCCCQKDPDGRQWSKYGITYL
jgi:hypothetical protein